MDIASVERRLDAGESLKIKYRYPSEGNPGYGVRSDKLLDVSVELRRFYTNFRGKTPIWLTDEEVLAVDADDGVYEDFAS